MPPLQRFSHMTSDVPFTRNQSRSHRSARGLMGALLCCVLFLLGTRHDALVHAQFVANPLVLNATYALVLNGIAPHDRAGITIAGVGDMNGDGVDDFVVGAYEASALTGQAFLLFGHNASTPWVPNPFELSALNGSNGVTINGVQANAAFGWDADGVGDVNGDSCNDVVIGSLSGSVAHLVFGRNGTWPAVITLTEGVFDGVTIFGDPGDNTGSSVRSAGDVNNDGINDIVSGALLADPSGVGNAGRMDVLYGRPGGSPWPSVVYLPGYVNGSTGFSLIGDAVGDLCGDAVSGVGDVNGDGVDDVATGCSRVDPYGVNEAGILAVVFGSSTGLPSQIKPSELNGTNGFIVNGKRELDRIGRAVSAIGDVNADGLDDLAFGAGHADANALEDSGEAYVLFGRNASVTPWPAQVNATALDGVIGFTLAGSRTMDFLGQSVSTAGDVNGDGIDDVLVGAFGESLVGTGNAFLLYGREIWPASQNSSDLDGATSVTFQGNAAGDNCAVCVNLLGDVNGDGRGDLAVGCFKAAVDGRAMAGQAVVVLGPEFTPAPTTAAPTTATPTTAPTTASPTTAPTTASPVLSPTTSPTVASAAPTSPPTAACDTEGAFVPSGSTCVNGGLVTNINTTVPSATSVTVATSVIVTEGASFEQPSGSTLVFVAAGDSNGAQKSTSIAVVGGGCATIEGDAVVNFEADPSNGGVETSTGTLVLVTADCVRGKFAAVAATTSFDGDECVAVGDGVQEAGANSISVSFAVRNTCNDKASSLSTGVLAGIVAGGVAVVTLVVVVAVKLAFRARERRAEEDVRMSALRGMGR